MTTLPRPHPGGPRILSRLTRGFRRHSRPAPRRQSPISSKSSTRIRATCCSVICAAVRPGDPRRRGRLEADPRDPFGRSADWPAASRIERSLPPRPGAGSLERGPSAGASASVSAPISARSPPTGLWTSARPSTGRRASTRLAHPSFESTSMIRSTRNCCGTSASGGCGNCASPRASTPRDILPAGTLSRRDHPAGRSVRFRATSATRPTRGLRECLTSFYRRPATRSSTTAGCCRSSSATKWLGSSASRTPNSFPPRGPSPRRGPSCSIGQSVSHHWHRRIDRVQTSGGLHIGMSIGDLEIVLAAPLQPHAPGRHRRLHQRRRPAHGTAGPSEIVVSNSFHQSLSEHSQARCHELEAVEARNVGRISIRKLVAP